MGEQAREGLGVEPAGAGFLFASLGAAVASVLKAGGVRFYENGVTSLNWPVSPQVVRSRASRSTHPETLLYVQRFLRLVLDRPDLAVDDPFMFRTKTEVVTSIAEHGAAELIGKSWSCAHPMFRTKGQWHCGTCSQCIDRRVALLAAGLGEHDSETDYETDVFTGPRKDGYEHNIAEGYARLAAELNDRSEVAIARAYSLYLGRATRCYREMRDSAEQFIDLHKRHAAAACSVLAEQVAAHSDDLVAGRIDRSSLLAMVAGQEHAADAQVGDGAAEPEPVAAGVQTDQNVFRRTNRRWTVLFGKHGPLDYGDLAGLRVIHYLLAHPRERVSALRLVHVAKGRTPSAGEIPFGRAANPDSEEAADSPEEAAIAQPGFGGRDDRLDAGELRDMKRRLRHAKAQLARAQRTGDQTETATWSTEVAGLQAVLDRDTAADGRSRPFIDELEKARKSVSHNVRYALDRIREDCQPLWRHLDAGIRMGSDFVYAPPPDCEWITE